MGLQDTSARVKKKRQTKVWRNLGVGVFFSYLRTNRENMQLSLLSAIQTCLICDTVINSKYALV
jgi:hypothetical protein